MWVPDNGRDDANGAQQAADNGHGEAPDEEFLEQEQLTLADDDEQLPWLEADDDFDDEGPDTGRLVGLAVLGLVAILMLAGAIWWFNRDGAGSPNEDAIAVGGTIEAPDEPYKTRPDDPGGATVEGTGDVSYQVGEGQAQESVVNDGAAGPSIDRTQSDAAAAATSDAPGVGVQVAAYSSHQQAEQGWNVLSGRFSALKGANHRVVTGAIDGGTIYRLQAVADSVAAAEAMCRSIRSEGGDCQVKR